MASPGTVIGFVGLDELTFDMAASLLASGYRVQAFEINESLMNEYLKVGGTRCASPMEAGKDVAAVVVLLSRADQINDTFFGPKGILRGLPKAAVIILCTSILPSYIEMLEKSLTVDGEPAFVVDAYASRGISEVLNGKLMITSSGRSDAIARSRPVLSAMCQKLYIFEGQIGAGSKVKMVNDLLEGIHLIASLEAISLGAQARIHPWIVYDIICNAAGNSWVFKNHVPQLLKGKHTKDNFLKTFVQNLATVLNFMKSLTFPHPLFAVAHQQLILGLSCGHRDNGDSTLIKVWEEIVGVNITDAANAETYSPEGLAAQITANPKTVNRIGFIGLGAMGFGMATHLLKSKFTVIGYDVTFLFHLLLRSVQRLIPCLKLGTKYA